MDFDLVIRKGKIVNGTGNPWFKADIGIEGEKIRKIGRLNADSAETTINAEEHMVVPGFIS